MKTVAIIPARGGSKGLPGKNLADVNGRPLIQYTIEQAIKAVNVDYVVVTSDSQEILDVSLKCGAHTIARPPNLATDTATTEVALQHGLNAFEMTVAKGIDCVVFLSCTQPYREVSWIEDCVSALTDDAELDSAFIAYHSHKNYWRKLTSGQHQKVWWKQYTNRQQREPILEENTGVACATRASIIREGKRIGSNCHIIEVDRFNLDIHQEEDLALARRLL